MPASSTEAEFAVPYGSLAAKLWGDPAKASVRVLALHGWRNNAGTFDTLIPLLSSEMFVVALDLSGHGLSSHKPAGCSYSYHEYVMDVCRVVQQLKWQDRFCIVGHSFGCTVGMMYAALFPDRVRAVVALDLYAPLHVPRERLAQDTSKLMSSFLHLEAKLGEAPTYTEEELLKRLNEATLFTLNTDTMRILMARDVVPASSGPENGKKLMMRTDPRTKVLPSQGSCRARVGYFVLKLNGRFEGKGVIVGYFGLNLNFSLEAIRPTHVTEGCRFIFETADILQWGDGKMLVMRWDPLAEVY